MELENIQAAWQSLDERLKKQESIKENIMKELILSKGNRSVSKLSNYDWFGLIVILLVLPIIPYFMYTQYHTFNMLSLILLFFFSGLLLFSAGLQIWKIRTLGQIDYGEQISNNVRAINRYNLVVKKEKSFMPVLFLLLILFYISRIHLDNTNVGATNIFLFFSFMLVGCVLVQWQYKALYKKNIDSIKRSLDELEELKEN